MHHYTFYPLGVCSRQIDLDIDENLRVHNIRYIGGCNGNLKALGALAEGMSVDEVIERLDGIRCGEKNTSCSDQLARNLKKNLCEIKAQAK
jgi:uncharacterized protein (TIGR03905 family)